MVKMDMMRKQRLLNQTSLVLYKEKMELWIHNSLEV